MWGSTDLGHQRDLHGRSLFDHLDCSCFSAKTTEDLLTGLVQVPVVMVPSVTWRLAIFCSIFYFLFFFMNKC